MKHKMFLCMLFAMTLLCAKEENRNPFCFAGSYKEEKEKELKVPEEPKHESKVESPWQVMDVLEDAIILKHRNGQIRKVALNDNQPQKLA